MDTSKVQSVLVQMIKIDKKQILIILLWAYAFHSAIVAIGLLIIQPSYMELFGLPDYHGKFFQMQGGVFHFVMSMVYIYALKKFESIHSLIQLVIMIKLIATVFLIIYYNYIESAWVVLASAAGDGSMALVLLLVYIKWKKSITI